MSLVDMLMVDMLTEDMIEADRQMVEGGEDRHSLHMKVELVEQGK